MTSTEPAGGERTRRVWDPFVRLFHWTLVFGFATAWLSAHGSELLHQGAGYLAAGLVLARVVWGFVGTTNARFAQFVRGPATVARYLGDVARGREARFIGHNPAGGAMILALLAMMAATALTGWMMTTDALFGLSWVETLHSVTAHGLLGLIALHLLGVALASWRHGENLARAMVTGRKRV